MLSGQICLLDFLFSQSNAACGVTQSEVPYDVATKLSDDGFNLKHKHLLHTTRGTLNIYSRYFILWANYSSLCLSLLMIGDQESFREKMFSSLLPLRHYCLSRASETWQLLSRNMNITVEERVQFVNQSIEHYYKVSHFMQLCIIILFFVCTHLIEKQDQQYLSQRNIWNSAESG